MGYQAGQIVYTTIPAAYGQIVEVLKEQRPTYNCAAKLENRELWFKPGDITVKFMHGTIKYDSIHNESESTTYRLADRSFAKAIRVIDDVRAEIKKLRESTKSAAKNPDGVDLEAAIKFLESKLPNR